MGFGDFVEEYRKRLDQSDIGYSGESLEILQEMLNKFGAEGLDRSLLEEIAIEQNTPMSVTRIFNRLRFNGGATNKTALYIHGLSEDGKPIRMMGQKSLGVLKEYLVRKGLISEE